VAPEAGIILPLLDSTWRKISQLEEAVDSRLEEEGRALAQAVANHILMCFQSRDPSISLEPAMQGPIEGSAEAARDGVEDAARVVAEQFEREPEDAYTFGLATTFPPVSVYSNNAHAVAERLEREPKDT
jgi:hypothetical protein